MTAALHDELRDLSQAALLFAARLEAVIALRSSGTKYHGKISFSQPPWNAPAADHLLAFHAQVRQLEHSMCAELGLPQRLRGGSDANTARAAGALLRLCAGAPDGSVLAVLKIFRSWCRQASIILTDTEAPRRLPRSPGSPEPVCPFCGKHTLRILPLQGLIRCIGDCTDSQGRRPSAHLEYSPVVHDWVPVWQDGIAGVPAA